MSPLEFIIAALVLSILVFIHELGHFLMAKKIGVRVEEFGFGLPPRIWGKKVGETIYSINWLPFGGFVKLTGEDPEEVDHVKDKKELRRYFWARTKKERAVVLLAGVTMNFLLAVAIISYIFTQGVFIPSGRVHIEKVVENSPAAQAGLEAYDIVISVDGKPVTLDRELIDIINQRRDQPTKLVLKRNGETLEKVVTPRQDITEDGKEVWRMGVVITNLEEKKYLWYQAPFYGMVEAFRMSYLMLSLLVGLFIKLVTLQPLASDTVAGPIRIVEEIGKASKEGIMPVLNIMGLLSLNLAIFNLLPIPALDGGRLLFVILEKFIGRRVKPRIELLAHQIGMVFFLGLLILVSINDILRKFKG